VSDESSSETNYMLMVLLNRTSVILYFFFPCVI